MLTVTLIFISQNTMRLSVSLPAIIFSTNCSFYIHCSFFMGLFIFFPLFCKNYFVFCTLLLCNFPIYSLVFAAVYDILGMQKYICNAYSHVYLFTYIYLFL